MIDLRDFSIGYGKRLLLSGVNASVKNTRLTALIGRNGTGKSTMLRALAGLNKDYGGEILYAGTDLSRMSRPEMARTIAFVNTERTRIPNLTCENVVAMGRAPYTDWIGHLRDDDRRIVAEALDAVGMSDYATRPMDTMSDGECQRIMIARALAQDTPVILLDEPTSFLDMPGRYELVALLRNLAHDSRKCVLFSTHELDIALRLCDDVALIDPPRLHILPAGEMRTRGYIDRLFGNDTIRFDALSGSVEIIE